MGVRHGRAGRGVVGGQHRRLARGATQDRVDEPVARPVAVLGQLDGLVDGRVDAYAIQEHELVEPEAQGRERRGVQALGRPARQLGDHMVERQAPLDRAE